MDRDPPKETQGSQRDQYLENALCVVGLAVAADHGLLLLLDALDLRCD